MSTFTARNTGAGWVVFAIALATYLLTLEPTASFGGCSEFIACSYKLQIPHPPGAPTFLLLGRLLSLLSFGYARAVPVLINALSGLSGAFAVLFLFWIITRLGRKLLLARTDFETETPEPTGWQTVLLLGADAVGALSFAFFDSLLVQRRGGRGLRHVEFVHGGRRLADAEVGGPGR